MKLENFKGVHKDKTCLLLGCGPSLSDYTQDQLRVLAKDKVVFSLKQSYNYCPDIAHYHCLNSCNITSYSYETPIPIILELAANELGWADRIAHHVLLTVGNNTDLSQSLSVSHEIDRWSLSNAPSERPWGPGLLWEVCLFMVAYMSFSELETIGVDLGEKGEKARKHFYGEGKRVNVLSEEETNNEIELSRVFNEWLASQGVRWTILSKGSYLDASIRRSI